MALRTGAQYLDSLRDGRRVVHDGRVIADVTAAPVFRRQAQTVARFYDFQNLPAARDLMSYETSDGDRAGIAFLEPRTREDLRRRAAAYAAWAEVSCGLLARSPDYMNTMITSLAGLAAVPSQADQPVARRMHQLYLDARRTDRHWTHTFVYPFKDHSRPLADNASALRIDRKTSDGIVVSGARGLATGAPVANLNFNLERVRPPEGQPTAVMSLSFALPVNAPGLTWVCRDVELAERPHFDSPLSGFADEVDAVAIFEEVFVPWESVIGHAEDYADLAKLVEFYAPWGEQLTKHQALVRFVAKTRFVLGLAHLVAESSGASKFINVKQRLGDIVLCLDALESMAIAAVETAVQDPASGWFYPNGRFASAGVRYFGEHYPRMVDHLRMLGASRYLSTPQERTLEVLGTAIEPYFKGSAGTARDNVGLYRMAWDLVGTSFGSRHDLYERFFAGDFEIQKVAAYAAMDKRDVVGMVERMLRATEGEPFPVPEPRRHPG